MDEEKQLELPADLHAALLENGFVGADPTISLAENFFARGGLYSPTRQVLFAVLPEAPYCCSLARISEQDIRDVLRKLDMGYYEFIKIPRAKALQKIEPMFHIYRASIYLKGGWYVGAMAWHPFANFAGAAWAQSIDDVAKGVIQPTPRPETKP